MGRPPDIRGSPERPGTGGLQWVPPCDDLLSGMEFPVNFLADWEPRPQMASMVRPQDVLLAPGVWMLGLVGGSTSCTTSFVSLDFGITNTASWNPPSLTCCVILSK